MPEGVAGIILAGGRSSRMGGGDKSLHLLDGRPILAHVIARLRRQVDIVALNANGDPARLAAFGLEVVADPLPDLGPLGGILAGMKWAEAFSAGISHIVTVAADTPFFPADLAERLLAADAGVDQVVLAASDGRPHPTFGLWPIALCGDLETFLEQEGAASVRAFASTKMPPLIIDFPVSDNIDPFFNVNTHEDLARARALAGKEN
jgi:molybdopterin-guanine dinucleotide biosynthesis protein A